MQRAIWSFALILLIPTGAQAVYTYTYTGNNFHSVIDEAPPAGSYTTDMRVTSHFTMPFPIAPDSPFHDISRYVESYSFNDGRFTLTEANSSASQFIVLTDSQGGISLWLIELGTQTGLDEIGDQSFRIVTANHLDILDGGEVVECVAVVDLACETQRDAGRVYDIPGTWTFIPEPSTALLLSIGLIGIAAHRRSVQRAYSQRQVAGTPLQGARDL
jgi:hypothetical protein